MFLYEFYNARINYYNQQLSQLPTGKISFNKRRNCDIVFIYYKKDGQQMHTEHTLNSERGQYEANLLAKRDSLKSLIDKYSQPLKTSSKMETVSINNPNVRITQLPSSLFDFSRKNVVPEHEKPEERYPCVYNGIKMTSRAEVTIAEVLSSLDLEFLYEPKVHIGAKYFIPDFLVNVPELDCCFFIEYLGMLSNDEYANKNFDKIRLYQANGISTDSALLVIWDNGKSMTDPTKVRLQIEEMINYLTIINTTPHA